MQGVRILRGNDRSAELTRCYDRLNAYKMRALIHPAERSRLGISAAVELIQSRPWDGIFAVNNALAHIHHKVGLPYILAADYLAVCVADIDIRIDSPRELSSRNAHKHGGVLVPPLERIALLDKGGGGTVALYMANRNIDTLDAGVPVLSMHAPFETTAKLDCYMAYKGMLALYQH